MPSDEGKQYRVYLPEEYPQIVELLHHSRGRYVDCLLYTSGQIQWLFSLAFFIRNTEAASQIDKGKPRKLPRDGEKGGQAVQKGLIGHK